MLIQSARPAVSIIALDINLYCIGIGDFKFAVTIGLVIRVQLGIKVFFYAMLGS